ncbi:MAG: transcription elongation factor GreA [Deltaproteobacteria bacterium]|nr:transcription elongation factor GreA [Deltaproteobacteria bacterium]
MTPRGREEIQVELKRLMSQERPKVLVELETAREHGDLSENAEYHAAKEKLDFIKGKIAELEDKLARAEVIDPSSFSGDRVVFGATVVLVELDDDDEKEVIYQIVGQDEADVKKGKINVESPLAKALIGKEQGDEVKVKTPRGVKEYEILEIRFE